MLPLTCTVNTHSINILNYTDDFFMCSKADHALARTKELIQELSLLLHETKLKPPSEETVLMF